MNQVQWWKNFDLNAEVHIAGAFLYDGLQSLNHSRTLNHDDEIFSVLYHLSVGFERLMKVIVVLAEHGSQTDQASFEDKLKTHNTDALLQRIERSKSLNVRKAERSLVRALTEFYGAFRYDHFRIETISDRGRLRLCFQGFLEKESGIKVSKREDFVPTDDMDAIQGHVDKVVRALAIKLYNAVDELARQNNIFTYELRSASKASMIFQGGEHTLQKEEIAMKELLLFFLKRSADTKLKVVTDNLDPLDFDPPEAVECADAFLKPDQRPQLVEMVNALRDERHDLKERDELLALLGSRANSLYTEDEMREMGATDEDLRKPS